MCNTIAIFRTFAAWKRYWSYYEKLSQFLMKNNGELSLQLKPSSLAKVENQKSAH